MLEMKIFNESRKLVPKKYFWVWLKKNSDGPWI